MSASSLRGPGRRGQLAVLGQLLFTVHLLHGRKVPLQLQRVAALRGLPISLCHDGHAFSATVQRHTQHRLHAFHGARRAVIHRSKARAEYWRASDHGRQLTGQANVDTKTLLPAALGACVETRSRAADDAEILRVLQRDLLGHRLRHRGLGQFAVTQLAAIRAQHGACLRAQGGDVHLPARCGGTEQHGACACTEFAILRKTVLDRIGTAGEVNAEARVDIGTVVRAMPAAHQAPVGVEFFSQDHRQCGLHALSELQPVDRHRDFAIGGDLHEGRWLFGRLERAGALSGSLRQCQVRKGAERQAAGAGQFQEAAARQRRGFVRLTARHQALRGTWQIAVVDVGQHGGSFRQSCGRRRRRQRGCGHRCRSGRCCRPWPRRFRLWSAACRGGAI